MRALYLYGLILKKYGLILKNNFNENKGIQMKLNTVLAIIFIFFSNQLVASEWRTCIGKICSQTQATFRTKDECSSYRSHVGSGWAYCFSVSGGVSNSFRACKPKRCSQEQKTFSSFKECNNYLYKERPKGWSSCFDPNYPPQKYTSYSVTVKID